jgi:NAD(P)-dependent dehydrogenase (short-subunit alcohol dehydrogenase family)
MRNRRSIKPRHVVITGAGSGIGRETALAFAQLGAEVVVSDVNGAAAQQTAQTISERGSRAHAYPLDVSDRAAVEAHAEEVAESHGIPDVVINNAGIGQAGSFVETSPEDFERVMNINFYGVVNGCRAFGAKMVARGTGGHIVNVSSMAAYVPQQSFSAYSTSKAAVFMFSDCLRAEFAHPGIKVSTICPGTVHTNIVATTHFSGLSDQAEKERQQKFDQLYRRRHYTPDRVAERIVHAVQTGKAIVPVTPEAHVAYHLRRLVPALGRWAAARKDIIG